MAVRWWRRRSALPSGEWGRGGVRVTGREIAIMGSWNSRSWRHGRAGGRLRVPIRPVLFVLFVLFGGGVLSVAMVPLLGLAVVRVPVRIMGWLVLVLVLVGLRCSMGVTGRVERTVAGG